ncbi:cupin domain-containing protein [Telluribacter sp. SYSU D00476]|uniref:cupin domain-containing protein n=1 Tax=Telluribacter sp. SYSU D00476 TaxID=2811430 RepID=UPI001FF4763D|nr:cupin domain-containing protein [Telluribacter sp. SYSU D00476]
MERRTFIQRSLVAAPLVGLTSVVEGIDTKPATKSFTVKTGEDRFNEPIKYRGINPNLVKISAKDTGGIYSIFEYEGVAKMGPDLHVHFKQDETFYVLDGEFLFQVGDQRQTLVAGDTIFLPRNVPHTWLQLSDRGKLMYLLQPAGKMEEFFKKMNALEGIPTAEVVQKIHLAHDLKVVGPPLTV